MIWIDVIRMKWRDSIHGLLQARDGTQRVLTGYPSQLFDGNPNQPPRSEQQEQELVWNMHPSTRKLHVAFHSLLYNFYTHKDLALPLDLQERILAMESQQGASTSQTSSPSPAYSNLRQKPTLAAQARHLKLSKLLVVMDKLIVVQEKMFRRLEKQTNLSEWVHDSLKRLFEVLESECDNIVAISVKFSTAKEDRFQMEQDINLINDAFLRILSSFRDVIQSWTDVVGTVRGAEAAALGSEDPWPDQDTIEELCKGLPERYKVDYEFLEAVLKEAADEEKWLEDEYSSFYDDDTSSRSGESDREERDPSPCEKPTVEAEVHHEDDIIQTERDDQPILKKNTAEKNNNANGSSKKSSHNGYQVLS